MDAWMVRWMDGWKKRIGYMYTQTENKTRRIQEEEIKWENIEKSGSKEYRKNTENGNTERFTLQMRWGMGNSINHSKEFHDIYPYFINS